MYVYNFFGHKYIYDVQIEISVTPNGWPFSELERWHINEIFEKKNPEHPVLLRMYFVNARPDGYCVKEIIYIYIYKYNFIFGVNVALSWMCMINIIINSTYIFNKMYDIGIEILSFIFLSLRICVCKNCLLFLFQWAEVYVLSIGTLYVCYVLCRLRWSIIIYDVFLSLKLRNWK